MHDFLVLLSFGPLPDQPSMLENWAKANHLDEWDTAP